MEAISFDLPFTASPGSHEVSHFEKAGKDAKGVLHSSSVSQPRDCGV